MDFLLENHTDTSSSSNRSSEIKTNQNLVVNTMSNEDVVDENEKKIITSGEESYDPGTNTELHLSIERGRRKKMKEMFDDLSALLPQLPSKVCISYSRFLRIFNNINIYQHTKKKILKKVKEKSLSCKKKKKSHITFLDDH